jgi:hypothetical protein
MDTLQWDLQVFLHVSLMHLTNGSCSAINNGLRTKIILLYDEDSKTMLPLISILHTVWRVF